MTGTRKHEALERLRRAHSKISELEQIESSSPEFAKWKRNTEVAIVKTFGETTRHLPDFTGITYSLSFFTAETPDHVFREAYLDGLKRARSVLESMLEEIGEYWEDDEAELVHAEHPAAQAYSAKKIFIVHGRDSEAKETVARFLQKLQLEPVILHEKANEGRTIVEKFEEYGRVGFAIVLLTPDDVGKLRTGEVLEPRARQNVIFEFGYFIGRLGRGRVCALRKGELEVPSDYDGVVYIPMGGSDGWQLALARELRNAGFAIDMNRVL